MNLAAATASLVDVDLSRKSRGDALQWREEDVEFMDEQRAWHELSLQHRKEDMYFRHQEIEQRNLINRRREIDEKIEQLKNIANISALIAGFSMILLVEMQFDESKSPEWLLSLYALATSLSACLMTFAYVTCTLILVGTLKKFEVFASYEEEASFLYLSRRSETGAFPNMPPGGGGEARETFQKTRFMLFWETTCEGDWNRAYLAFSLGVPCFLASMSLASWIKFLPLTIPAILISVICGITVLILFWNTHMKWGKFLTASRTKDTASLTNNTDSSRRTAGAMIV